MGNCLRVNNKVSAQAEKHHDPAEEVGTAPMPLKEPKPKKTVRFDLQEVHHDDDDDDQESGGGVNGGDSKSGAVRIRLVVTQEELKQLLSYRNDSNKSSLEELLSAVKSRGRRMSKSDESVSSSEWRPTLESIPEDRC